MVRTSAVIVVALIGVGCSTVAYLLLRKIASAYSPAVVVFGVCMALSVASLLVPSRPWVALDRFTFSLALGAGIAALVGQILLTYSFTHLTAVRATMLTVAGLLTSILLESAEGRSFSIAQWTGFAAICSAVVITALAQRHRMLSKATKLASAANELSPEP